MTLYVVEGFMGKVLITGATGLIGSHLVEKLKKEHELYLLVRSKGEKQEGIHEVIYDLGSSHSLPELPGKIDAVIHLAQSDHFREFPEKAEDVFQVNTVSTLQLLEYARRARAKSFLLASSGVVYGSQGSFSEDEEILLKNEQLGFYHTSKLCAEAVAENYAGVLNVQILRFFFVYGRGQKSSMLIPRLIDSVKEGRPITLDGEEGLQINPVYVEDATEAIYRALGLQGSHKINVGGREVLTLREIGEQIGEELGKSPLFEVRPSLEQKQMIGTVTRMKELLGEPSTSFREGIARMIEVASDS